MKKIFAITIVLSMAGILMPLSAQRVKIELKKVLEIGSGDLILGRVRSVAQDQQGNIYIPDSKSYRVHKFTPDGRHLLSFGRKGEGPGDFKYLYKVSVSEKNEVVVGDLWAQVSFFNTDGEFVKKYDFSKLGFALIPQYAGNGYLVVEKSNQKLVPEWRLVTIFPTIKMIKEPVLTMQELLRYSGKDFAFTFNSKEFGEGNEHASCPGLVAVSGRDKYKIRIINSRGQLETRIDRELKNPPLSRAERDHIINTQVMKDKRMSTKVKNDLKSLIPHHKNLVAGLAVSRDYLLVERVKEDILREDTPVPVDVFTIRGEFLGQTMMKRLPVLITKKFMYFIERNQDDDLLVTKYEFRIKKN